MKKLSLLVQFIWALPGTLLGLLMGFLLKGKFSWQNDWVVAIYVEKISFWIFDRFTITPSALTLGRAILFRGTPSARTIRHEDEHVRQWSFWGVFFIPLYLIASFYGWFCLNDAYNGNYFEMKAFEAEKD